MPSRGVAPLLPDSGVPFQLVHHDDVATAIRAVVTGRGSPGTYNLASEEPVTAKDVARELGWHTLPVPRAAIGAAAEIVSRVPRVPAEAMWINVLRKPILMDIGKARRELGWRPEHGAREILRETVAAARAAKIV